MKVPEQLTRLGVVFAVLVIAIVLVRFVLLPPRVFSTALHQAATVERETAKPVHFAGTNVCRECHEEQYDTKIKGYHKGLACEICHGPSAAHTEDPMSHKPPAPRDRKFCPVCHAYDPARPTGFPQINPTIHNPGLACITCHNPHDPVPPEVPHECSACHGEIARTKSLSSHAKFPCTTCHTVSEQHKITPRSALPTKPEAREFCGTCHAQGGGGLAEAPKIDLATHGGTYLCWQCHYPHLPEGRR